MRHEVTQRNSNARASRGRKWFLASAMLLTVLCGRGAWAADAILSWSPNTESDLAGYRIHYGTAPGAYTTTIDVGRVTSYTVTGLSSGTYYFVLTAYNNSGAESGYSTQVSKVIPDTQPPGISGVAAGSVSSTAATITWTTNEPATSQVEYGTGTGYGLQTTEDPALVGGHVQRLTGLQASTTYHYRVLSRDAAGNLSVSTDRTFTTPAADVTAPVISAVATVSVTSISATVTWATNEAATTQVQYGTTTAYGATTALNSSLLTTHSQALTGLAAATVYYYRVLSRDAAGNLATSGNFTFRTLAAADTTPPVISAVTAAGITATGATIQWTTNEAATTQVQYGRTTAYGSTTPLNSTRLTSHSQALTGLAAATVYYYRVLSRDAAGNLATSGNFTFRTLAATGGTTRVDFTYPNRSALLADGWSFVAKTRGGGTRNTEQTGSLAVNYDQTSHPGSIRIPLGQGELWQALNNSQNMLFRTLPSDWRSIRLRIASFSPAADYQQVGLLAYQDDDNYVNVQRNFNSDSGGPVVGFFRETAGSPIRTDRRSLANSGNLILRLDRDPATNTFRAFYSTNSGSTWVQLTGAPTQSLTNPRLAIQVGANLAGTLPTAHLSWVEILR